MCRLLVAADATPFPLTPLLASFAAMARDSVEWQGDGWGCAWRADGIWHAYHALCPVWEDDLTRFASADLLLAHARSAFRNEGIVLGNNMPFIRGERIFIFNGELRGVRLNVPGRIGAEKLFNLLVADEGDREDQIRRSLRLLRSRTRSIRAMNFALVDGDQVFVHGEFSGEADYFTLWRQRQRTRTVICSMPLFVDESWQPLPNPCDEVFRCSS